MRMSTRAVATVLFAAAFAPVAMADGLVPGSVLVYPLHRSGTLNSAGKVAPGPFFTLIAVTNTNRNSVISGLGGSTNIHWEYVNAIYVGENQPLNCVVQDQIEFLTPADTRVVLTNCHNPTVGREGYLVISAQDPTKFSTPWSHNYLAGSEIAINGPLIYVLNAIPFDSPDPDGTATDHDLDRQLDFDGLEYEPIPDHLYLDFFVDAFDSSIVLINMSGGFAFTASVAFDIFNDNERSLSATYNFNCWSEEYLRDISLVFTQGFLENNTVNDPTELDIDCDGDDDYESGWARIRGLTNSSTVESYPNPALLGAISTNVFTSGGRRMWESVAKQTNGDFYKTGTDDPEFP